MAAATVTPRVRSGVAQWSGPRFELSSADEAFMDWTPEQYLGLPASEVWADPLHADLLRLMAHVYATGEAAALWMGHTRISVTTYQVAGVVAGVGTYFGD